MYLYRVGHLEWGSCTIRSQALQLGQTRFTKGDIRTKSKYVIGNVTFVIGLCLTELNILGLVKQKIPTKCFSDNKTS